MADDKEEQEETQKEKAKPAEKLLVRLVGKLGDTVLVEFVDGEAIIRKSVKGKALSPTRSERHFNIEEKDFKAGKNYGEDWEKFFKYDWDGEAFKNALNKFGIFTYQEFLDAGVPKIASVLMGVLATNANKMTVQVREALEKGGK